MNDTSHETLNPQGSTSEGTGEPFSESPAPSPMADIEDIGQRSSMSSAGRPMVTKRKFGQMKLGGSDSQRKSQGSEVQLSKSWREVLGESPKWGPSKVRWQLVVLMERC